MDYILSEGAHFLLGETNELTLKSTAKQGSFQLGSLFSHIDFFMVKSISYMQSVIFVLGNELNSYIARRSVKYLFPTFSMGYQALCNGPDFC